jgi:pimeloyl-ACP methyl ester carboxylesterase
MKRRIASFDKTRISYDIDRNGSDPLTLIFVHGAGGDLLAWKKERDFFHQKGYSTLAIDLRGHGLSGRPASFSNYDLDNFAMDLKRVIDKEKISSFIIIGHCFGGIVAINFQKLYPDMAAAFVLIDTTSKAPQSLRIACYLNLPLLRVFNYLLSKRQFDDKLYRYAETEKFVGSDDLDISRLYSDITHTTFRSWIYTYQQLAGFDGQEILKGIKVPTLIIHGAKDQIFGIREASKMSNLISESVLDIVPEASHIIVINHPDELDDRIYKFLNTKLKTINT